MAIRRKLDFVVLCETKLRDATLIRALADSVAPGMHLRVLSSCRPPSRLANGELAPASGGILVLILNPNLTILDSWDDKKGILSFSACLPGSAPFACVCVYLPDASSPFSYWSDGLLEASAAEVRRRRSSHGDAVFWLGDFNIRVGRMRGHETVDINTAASSSRRARRLRYFMRAMAMRPTHGRDPNNPADFTSRQIAGRCGAAEVDYIIAPSSIPLNSIRFIATPQWGSTELQSSGTHLPLFVEVDLPQTPDRPKQKQRRPRRPFFLPPYSDAKWFAIHRRIARDLPRALQKLRRSRITLEECHATLTTLFRSAAVAECGTGMVRVRSFKHRLYRGCRLPAEIVALFDLARSQRKQRKRAGGPRLREFWTQEARATHRTASQMADQFLRRFRDTLLSNLQHQMRIDPHQSHSYLTYLRGAEATNCADPSSIPPGPDGQPPLVRFSRACEQLVAQTCATPEAVSDESWMGDVFRAPGGKILVRLFSARELYPFFFPPTQRHRFKPCHNDCRICRQYCAEVDRWRQGDPLPEFPVPHHRGTLHTSRGADLSGLVAELLRWVRPEDFRDRYDYRIAVCSLLADFFNHMLQRRAVPAGAFTACVSTPIYKAVKPGVQPPPRWNDDAYRFITNSSLFAKAFSTVLASRISHWAVRTGLLSEQQVAFLPFRGTEEHVFTLQQIARERARRKQLTYLLFIDFKKAYDSVHLDALWAVLERQGVPVSLIDLLRDWASKRTTQVRVNGELSEPFSMSKGVPQGDPLSCLLFNLYIDSLSRFLSSRPDLRGVNAFRGGILLQHLLYADDLVGFASSATELQRILSYVKMWADAWGMQLNTGVGKTEAMVVCTDPDTSAAMHPPLRLDDGRTVGWTISYRYLGYALRCDLQDCDAIDGMLSHLNFLWHSHFAQNGIVRHASAAFQMQFYCTMVQGSLRHLRALTSIYSHDAERLEAVLRRHIRDILGLRSKTPVDLVSAMGAMLPWHAVHAQEHERLYLQLSNSLFPESIAARVFRLAQADPQIGTSFANRNWVRHWERERAAASALGIRLAAPPLYYERISAAAKSFGRAFAFVHWQLSGKTHSAVAGQCDASTLPSYRPSEAVANLFENYTAPLASLGNHSQFTPLSAHGPGCSGSIPTRSNVAAPRLGPIAWARTGAAAMLSPLFASQVDTDGGHPTDHAASSHPCALCNVTPLDPYHLITECNHAIIDSWRQGAEAAAKKLLRDLTAVMASERDRAGRDPECALLRRVRRAAARLDFDSPEGDFVLYRLLVAQPWPERMACPGMRLVRLLGRAFDLPGVPHRFERPLLDMWCRWSIGWLWALSRAWRSASQPKGVPPGHSC